MHKLKWYARRVQLARKSEAVASVIDYHVISAREASQVQKVYILFRHLHVEQASKHT
jgi:hypothetical protein